MKRLLLSVLAIFVIACSSYKGTESGKDGRMLKVERDKLAGVTMSEDVEEILTDSQVRNIARMEIAKAEAEAEKQDIMFDVNKRQNREKIKTMTAKYVSWVCFGLALAAIGFAVFTKGYKRWGIMGATFFVTGMVSLLIPELTDYIKWVIVAGGAAGIVLALSHTKEWHAGKLLGRKKGHEDVRE